MGGALAAARVYIPGVIRCDSQYKSLSICILLPSSRHPGISSHVVDSVDLLGELFP